MKRPMNFCIFGKERNSIDNLGLGCHSKEGQHEAKC